MTNKNNNDVLMEELMQQAESATEPGETRVGDVLERKETPTVINSITSAGYVYIYDTLTGERSVTNRNMLKQQLGKKREDGTRVFTTIKPAFEPKRGSLKCLLHPDDLNRAHYDALGLAICRKHNLTSPYQVQRHMERRHPAEWKTIEAERIQKEKQEDRDFQRGIIDMVRKK